MTKENRVAEGQAMVGVGSPKLDSQARSKQAEAGVHLDIPQDQVGVGGRRTPGDQHRTGQARLNLSLCR